MKQLLQITLKIYTLIGVFLTVYAQEAVPASGGEASGSGGSVSYSAGQVVYTTHTATTGSVAQGVQQAFEISTVLGVEDHLINLSFMAYPNPTTDMLTLKIDNFNQNNMKYALFDIQGRLLVQQKIQQINTNISTKNLSPSIYFLKIFGQNNLLKTFKIIKN